MSKDYLSNESGLEKLSGALYKSYSDVANNVSMVLDYYGLKEPMKISYDKLSEITNATWEKTKDFFKKREAINSGVIAGTITSLILSTIAVSIGEEYQVNKENYKWLSIISEKVSFGVTMGLVFYNTKRSQGVSRRDALFQLGKVASVAAPLGLSMYMYFRAETTDYLINSFDIQPKLSSFISQLSMTFVYIGVLDVLANRLDIVDKMKKPINYVGRGAVKAYRGTQKLVRRKKPAKD